MNKNFMPQNQETIDILKGRADVLSHKVISDEGCQDTVDYVKFKLGEEHYGIPYKNTKEVLCNVDITDVPFAPDYICGTISHRGKLFSVLSLRKLFNCDGAKQNNDSFVILVKNNDSLIGVLVDDIEGSEFYDAVSLQTSFASSGVIKQEYILGLHHGVTGIINIESLLDSINI